MTELNTLMIFPRLNVAYAVGIDLNTPPLIMFFIIVFVAILFVLIVINCIQKNTIKLKLKIKTFIVLCIENISIHIAWIVI